MKRRMWTEPEEPEYWDPATLNVGAVTELTDQPHRKKKHPLGFYTHQTKQRPKHHKES